MLSDGVDVTVRVRNRRRIERGSTGALEVGELEGVERVSTVPDGGVRLGHLSDFHYGKPLDSGRVPERVERWLAAFRERGVDVVVYTGDIVETPDDRVGMLRMRHLLDEAGMSWVGVPGNHDIRRPGEPSPFYEIFGGYPRVEQVAGVAFVLLDSFGGLSVRERDPFDRLDARRTGAFSKGRVGEEQLAEVAPSLGRAGDGPRVLVTHHHLRAEEEVVDEPSGTSAPEALMVPCLDADRVLDWARHHHVDLAFHGHMHAHWPPYVPEGGPPVLNSGSSTRGKPTPRARIVDLEPGADWTIWELQMTHEQ